MWRGVQPPDAIQAALGVDRAQLLALFAGMPSANIYRNATSLCHEQVCFSVWGLGFPLKAASRCPIDTRESALRLNLGYTLNTSCSCAVRVQSSEFKSWCHMVRLLLLCHYYCGICIPPVIPFF